MKISWISKQDIKSSFCTCCFLKIIFLIDQDIVSLEFKVVCLCKSRSDCEMVLSALKERKRYPCFAFTHQIIFLGLVRVWKMNFDWLKINNLVFTDWILIDCKDPLYKYLLTWYQEMPLILVDSFHRAHPNVIT